MKSVRQAKIIIKLISALFLISCGPNTSTETLTVNSDENFISEERLESLERLIANNQEKSILEKLSLTNDFFNQMEWIDDKDLWDSIDYWATPSESIQKFAGDCEDFAIAKFFTLLKLNLNPKHLRISYAVYRENNQAHMVLSYHPDNSSAPLILDNINKRILTRSIRNSDLRYIFSFNLENIWLDTKSGLPRSLNENPVNLWSQLRKKMGVGNIEDAISYKFAIEKQNSQ